MLKSLTKPVTQLVVRLDTEVLTGWARNLPQYENTSSVLKQGCHRYVYLYMYIFFIKFLFKSVI